MKSFKYAFAGLKKLFISEHNARVHAVACLIAICLGVFFRIEAGEWLWIALACTLVFAAELFNSAIERLADYSCNEQNEFIKNSKDYAAAGVLMCAFFSLIVAAIIFIPRIIEILGN